MERTSGSEQNNTPVSEIAQQWADGLTQLADARFPASAAKPADDWRQVASEAVSQHRAIQHSAELGTLLALAASLQVRTVLEIGTYAGGSAWAFGQLPSVSRIITVDVAPQAEAYSTIYRLAPVTTLITSQSVQPDVREHVIRTLDGTPPDLLFIDGSHLLESVTADWTIYGPMVRPGGLVVFAGTQQQYTTPDCEVNQLWRRVRQAYPAAEITAAPNEWAGLGIIWR